MANLQISKNEIIFLRNEILNRYSTLTGRRPEIFEQELTGTIANYDKIAFVMQDHIEDENNLRQYLQSIEGHPLSVEFRKIKEATSDGRKIFIRNLASSVSGNVLRKLIFYGPGEDKLAFKEDFINACYYYIGKDRVEFLRTHSLGLPKQRSSDTVSSFGSIVSNTKDKTVNSFVSEKKFALRVLSNTNELEKNEAPRIFSGDATQLNRANLDKNNVTLTSKVQAEITNINGEWYIENKSALGTTFIFANRPMRICKGDIIVMGNKRFLFDEE